MPGSNYKLGLIFERTQAEENGHRAALREAIVEASARRRGYDDPWWAANMKALLDYTEACEAALAKATAMPCLDSPNGCYEAKEALRGPVGLTEYTKALRFAFDDETGMLICGRCGFLVEADGVPIHPVVTAMEAHQEAHQ